MYSFLRAIAMLGGVLLCLSVEHAWGWNPLVLDGRCRQSGEGCFATIGNAGQSRGACCDPLDKEVGKCVSNNPCIGGKPYRWAAKDLPLNWYLNLNQMQGREGFRSLSNREIEAAIQTAWDAWSQPRCTSFQHKYGGITSTKADTSDGKVVIVLSNAKQWAEMGQDPSTLAFTRPVPNGQGEMQDADILLSPRTRQSPWRISPPSGLDLIKVVAHEVGHALGFAHTHLNALMYFANLPGKLSSLARDDTDAVCFSYPKKNCQSDEDCGGCRRCASQQCVEVRIAPVRNLCRPCAAPKDCGGNFDICVRLKAGNRCAQACDDKSCCPKGFRCADIGQGQRMCIPESGECPDVSCQGDTDCGPGEGCSQGRCRPKEVRRSEKVCFGCNSDKDCGDGACFTFPQGINRCAMRCVADNFCPKGFFCRLSEKGRYCFPKDWICPCAKPRDCWTGEACKEGFCRPRACGYGCVCSSQALCPSDYRCASTDTTNICVKLCGQSAMFAPGAPGGSCSDTKACALGAKCLNIEGNQVCLKPCKISQDCASTGGLCYEYRGGRYCMCRNKNECGAGQLCNTTFLGVAGAGACAPKRQSPPSCPKGFECRDLGSIELCLPQSSGTGQACGNQRPCKSGHVCARTSNTSDSGVCLELCSNQRRCNGGGVCILELNNESRACGCRNAKQCLVGQSCETLVQSVGICKGSTASHCGNETCEIQKGENCLTCPADCSCKQGEGCLNLRCQKLNACGNKVCEPDLYENCESCPQDCVCRPGQTCTNERCVDKEQSDGGSGDLCPGGTITTNDQGQRFCVTPGACSCSGQAPSMLLLPWLLTLLFGFSLRVRQNS